MRSERTEMVQTVEQLEFVYLAISKFDFNKKSTALTHSKKTTTKLEKTTSSKVSLETSFPLEQSQIYPTPPTTQKPKPPLNKPASQIFREEKPKNEESNEDVKVETEKLKRKMQENQENQEKKKEEPKTTEQDPNKPERMTAFWDDLTSDLNNINDLIDE